MWSEWLVRYCETAPWRPASDHIFPASPLSRHPLLPDMNGTPGNLTPDSNIDELVSLPSCVVRSPVFENAPRKYRSCFKVLSPPLLCDEDLSPRWHTAEQRKIAQIHHIAKKYLQNLQDFKHYNNVGDGETPTTSGEEGSWAWPTTKASYADMRAGFWKQLTEHRGTQEDAECVPAESWGGTLSNCCQSIKHSNGSLHASTGGEGEVYSSETLGSIRKRPVYEGKSNVHERLSTNRERVTTRRNTVEMEVVVSGKRKSRTDDPNITRHSGRGLQPIHWIGDAGVSLASQDVSSLESRELNGYEDVSSVFRENGEGCQKGVSQEGNENTAEGGTKAEENSLSGREGSVFRVGSGGIGRGRIAKDGSPISLENHCEPWDRRPGAEGVECKRKDDYGDRIMRNCMNWCVVDSYITGNGKETTWTVQGFGEEGHIFDGKSAESSFLDCKEGHMEMLSDIGQGCTGAVIAGTRLEDPDIKSRHGIPPRWTQQALQERVKDNLKETNGEMNGQRRKDGHIGQYLADGSDDGSTVEHENVERDVESCSSFIGQDAGHRQVLLDELASMRRILHCGKSLKVAILLGTRENVLGDETDGAVHIDERVDPVTKRDVRRYSALNLTSVGSSSLNSVQENYLSTGGPLRDFRRRKRGWLKKRGQLPTAALACAASMIGDTVEAVHRVRKDAAALAFKLAELHAGDAKALRSAASIMRHHVDSLHSDVQGFQSAWANKEAKYPWQQLLKELVVAVSLVSGAFTVPTVLNALRRVLGSFQIPATRKEKMVLAAVVLSISARFGSGIWQSLGHVQSIKKDRDVQLREQLRLILWRTSAMCTLSHLNMVAVKPYHMNSEDERCALVVA